jgi:hypothetical protein
MATATAMPAPHTPQTALRRKMIAVVMHVLPMRRACRRSEAHYADLLHACMPALVAEQSQGIANVPSKGLASAHDQRISDDVANLQPARR